jgi:hypothetical protein
VWLPHEVVKVFVYTPDFKAGVLARWCWCWLFRCWFFGSLAVVLASRVSNKLYGSAPDLVIPRRLLFHFPYSVLSHPPSHSQSTLQSIITID